MATTQAAAPQKVSSRDLSRPDYNKQFAAHLFDSRPYSYCLPTGQDLDQLFGGELETTNKLYEHIVRLSYEWFDDFMPALNWWIVLSDLPLDGENPPTIAHHRKVLSELLVDVLMAYEPAHQEANSYAEPWPDGKPTLELLKKYRVYTKYVSALVLEVWPDLDFELKVKTP